MSLLKKNVVANLGGQAISALVGLFLIPLYLRFLGQEGYGLVSFFVSIQAMALVLDLGLSTTANREVGRLAAQNREGSEGRNLVRTLEVAYCATGLTLFTALALFSNWIAHEWIKADEIAPATIQQCVLIAAATIGMRWPMALYYGVMKGLERQVQMNVLYSLFSAGRAICTLLVLVLVARSVLSFYVFQLLFGILEIFVIRHAAWKGIGGVRGGPARFQFDLIKNVWRYALSVSWVSIFAIGLKQVDKVLISKMLPIEQLGFYTTAALAGMGISKIGAPIQAAVFPRFSKLLTLGDKAGVATLFHSSAQALTYLTAAAAGGLMFFGKEILLVWTRSPELADQAAGTLSITAAAMLLNGMMSAPFTLILASGYTRISVYMNGLGLLGLTPLTYALIKSHGLSGAAYAWLVFNIVYIAVVPAALARKIPEIRLRQFYLQDILPIGGLAICVFAVAAWLSHGATAPVRLAWGTGAGLVDLALGLLLFPKIRKMALTAPGVPALMARLRGIPDATVAAKLKLL